MKKKTSLVNLSLFLVAAFFCLWSLKGTVSGHLLHLSDLGLEKKDEIKEWLDTIIYELEGAEEKGAEDIYDYQAVIREVGEDPVKLFEWVRDHTFWVPYRGLLKGAEGVLMDRLGNSLDRSLLLADLLDSAGYRVRFAHAGLSGRQTKRLLDDMRKNSDTRAFKAFVQQEIEASLFEDVASRLQMDKKEMTQGLKQLSQINRENDKDTGQRVINQAKWLMGTIGDLKADGRILQQAVTEALGDHWWIQVETEEGWMDLDPLLPRANPGEVIEEAEDTVEPEELNGDQFHSITVRVVAERWKDGALDERTALEHTLRPCEMSGKRIVLYTLSMNWPTDLRLDEEGSAERFRDAILEVKEWMPVLEVGPDMIVQSSFTDKGGINENPNPSPEAEAGGTVSGLFRGVTGGLTGGSSKEEEEGVLTAGWLEYEIHSPGQDKKTIRREIFDILGPSARMAEELEEPDFSEEQRLERGYGLFGIIEILPLVSQILPAYAERLMSHQCLEQLRILREELEDGNPPGDLNISIGMAAGALLSPLYRWALLRPRWNPHADHVFLGSANIVNLRTRAAEDTGGEFLLRRTFDIVKNDISILSQANLSLAEVCLTQGVADTAAEAMVIPGPHPHMNLYSLIDSAKEQGIGWRLVKDPRDKGWEKGRLSEDVRVRIEQSLRNGWAVVVPEKPVVIEGKPRLGWWRVNLQNGETLGVMDTGFHQETTEYTEQEMKQIRVNCVDAINTLHKATRGGPAPFPLPSNMSFADFIELLNYQNWKYLDPERVLRLWELAKMSGALAGL